MLGANGTGKSSLMQQFSAEHPETSRRISAHRYTTFQTNSINITPAGRQDLAINIRGVDSQPRSRHFDDYAQQRPSAALFDLINLENQRARGIAQAFGEDNMTLARELNAINAPVKAINELLQLSNLPIEISFGENDSLLARKSGGQPYSIAELSDGERNALLIAAEVLSAAAETLILIDEPERHLHRSIVSPLLLNLFSKRRDCKFVISTHDLSLPLDSPDAQILLIRDCIYQNTQFRWRFDLATGGTEIDDDIKKDLLGARKKILYIEGEDNSLDKGLYSLVFPDISIIPKGNCAQIERIVPVIRNEASLNWVSVFGLIDNDRRPPAEVANLAERGVYALSVYSVESIYYHPQLQTILLQNNANAQNLMQQATATALAEIRTKIPMLSQWVSEKKVRAEIFRNLPKRADMANQQALQINIDVPAIVAQEAQYLSGLCDANNLSAIIENYPVRSTGALTAIATRLGYTDRPQYEEAIRQLLIQDADAIALVRSWFGGLNAAIAAA